MFTYLMGWATSHRMTLGTRGQLFTGRSGQRFGSFACCRTAGSAATLGRVVLCLFVRKQATSSSSERIDCPVRSGQPNQRVCFFYLPSAAAPPNPNRGVERRGGEEESLRHPFHGLGGPSAGPRSAGRLAALPRALRLLAPLAPLAPAPPPARLRRIQASPSAAPLLRRPG